MLGHESHFRESGHAEFPITVNECQSGKFHRRRPPPCQRGKKSGIGRSVEPRGSHQVLHTPDNAKDPSRGPFALLAQSEGFEPSILSILSIPCKGIVSGSFLSAALATITASQPFAAESGRSGDG